MLEVHLQQFDEMADACTPGRENGSVAVRETVIVETEPVPTVHPFRVVIG